MADFSHLANVSERHRDGSVEAELSGISDAKELRDAQELGLPGNGGMPGRITAGIATPFPEKDGSNGKPMTKSELRKSVKKQKSDEAKAKAAAKKAAAEDAKMSKLEAKRDAKREADRSKQRHAGKSSRDADSDWVNEQNAGLSNRDSTFFDENGGGIFNAVTSPGGTLQNSSGSPLGTDRNHVSALISAMYQPEAEFAAPGRYSRFFVGEKSRDQAEGIMISSGRKIGDFLIRESNHRYVLSVCLGASFQHRIVAEADDGQVLVNGTPMPGITSQITTIGGMLEYLVNYRTASVTVTGVGLQVYGEPLAGLEARPIEAPGVDDLVAWNDKLHGKEDEPDHRPWVVESRNKRDSMLSLYSGFGSDTRASPEPHIYDDAPFEGFPADLEQETLTEVEGARGVKEAFSQSEGGATAESLIDPAVQRIFDELSGGSKISEGTKLKAKEFFAALDVNGDGTLSFGEMQSAGMDEGTFRQIDTNGNGAIEKKEFRVWRRDNKAAAARLVEGRGTKAAGVTIADVHKYLAMSGAYLTAEDLSDMVADCEPDTPDGTISAATFQTLYNWSAVRSSVNCSSLFEEVRAEEGEASLDSVRQTILVELGNDLPVASYVTLYGGTAPRHVVADDMAWLIPALLQTQQLRLNGLFAAVADSMLKTANADDLISVLKSYGYNFTAEEFDQLIQSPDAGIDAMGFVTLYASAVKAWQVREPPAVEAPAPNSISATDRMLQTLQKQKSTLDLAQKAHMTAAQKDRAAIQEIEARSGQMYSTPLRPGEMIVDSESKLTDLFKSRAGSLDGVLDEAQMRSALTAASILKHPELQESSFNQAVVDAEAQNALNIGFTLDNFIDICGLLIQAIRDPKNKNRVENKLVDHRNKIRQNKMKPNDPGTIPHDSMENTRTKKSDAAVAEYRRVNEQISFLTAGEKTMLGYDSVLNQTVMKSTQLQSKQINPGIYGNVKREGAEVSYYRDDLNRFADPAGALDFEAIATVNISDDKNLSPFFHPGVRSKAEAEAILLSKGTSGLFLIRLQMHGVRDALCLSVLYNEQCTHHVLTKTSPEAPYSISLYPFHVKNVPLFNCFTVAQVLEALKRQKPFWPLQLKLGMSPNGDVKTELEQLRVREGVSPPPEFERVKISKSAMFSMLDIDGDGTIQLEEMLALGMDEKTFSKIDIDNSGTIDKSEFKAWRKENPKAAKKMMQGEAVQMIAKAKAPPQPEADAPPVALNQWLPKVPENPPVAIVNSRKELPQVVAPVRLSKRQEVQAKFDAEAPLKLVGAGKRVPVQQRNLLAPAIQLASQTPPKKTSQKKRRLSKSEAFKKMDVDGSGKISLEEMLSVGMDEETFSQMDADGNGQVDKKEFRAWRTANPIAAKTLMSSLLGDMIMPTEDPSAPKAAWKPRAPGGASKDNIYTTMTIYYHKGINKKAAEEKLLANDGAKTAGKFLIRDQGKAANEYILSVVYKEKPTHHTIVMQGNGVITLNKTATKCKTVAELIKFCAVKQKSIKWPVPLLVGVAVPGASAAVAKPTPKPTPVTAAPATSIADALVGATEGAMKESKWNIDEKAIVSQAILGDADDNAFSVSRELANQKDNFGVRKVFSNVGPQIGDPTIDTTAVEMRRSKHASKRAFQSKKIFSNIVEMAAGNRPLIDAYDVNIQRDKGAQQCTDQFRRVNVQISKAADVSRDAEVIDATFRSKDVDSDTLLAHYAEDVVAKKKAAMERASTKYKKPYSGLPQPKVLLADRLESLHMEEGNLANRAKKIPLEVAPEAREGEEDEEEEAVAELLLPNAVAVEKFAFVASGVSAAGEPDPAQAIARAKVSFAEGMPAVYHGKIDKAAADSLLLADGGAQVIGKHLVRDGPDGQYVLSVIYKGAATHHAIAKVGGKFAINKKVSDKTSLGDLLALLAKKNKALNWPVDLVSGVVAPGAGATPDARPKSERRKSERPKSERPKSERPKSERPKSNAPQNDDAAPAYYHGKLKKSDAEARLLADNGSETTGRFLVRDGGTPTEWLVSVIYKGQPTHHQIVKTEAGTFSINGAVSSETSMPALVALLAKKNQDLKWPVPLVAPVAAP